MPRRVSLPGASELFRQTRAAEPTQPANRDQSANRDQLATRDQPAEVEGPDQSDSAARPRRAATTADGTEPSPNVRGSGRIRHEEKITVYVSSEELLALEQARLTLRARHGMAVDRGRIVRQAIAAALADLEENGDESELIRRLAQ